MLPFLQPKRMTTVMMTHAKPDGQIEDKEMPEDDHALLSAAEDLIKGHGMKDAMIVAQALKAAFEVCMEKYEKEMNHAPDEIGI